MNKDSFASTPGSIVLPSGRFGILKQSQSRRASEGKAAKKEVTSSLPMDKAMTYVTMHMDMTTYRNREALHAQKDVRQPCDGTGAVKPVWDPCCPCNWCRRISAENVIAFDFGLVTDID